MKEYYIHLEMPDGYQIKADLCKNDACAVKIKIGCNGSIIKNVIIPITFDGCNNDSESFCIRIKTEQEE